MNIRDYLMKNEMQNAPMLDLIKREHEIVSASTGGVILYDPYSETYFVSVDDNSMLSENVFVKGRKAILVLREKNIAPCVKISGFEKIQRGQQVVCFAENFVYVPSKSIEIRPLTLEYLDVVCKHYSLGLGEKYIRGRIESSNLFGAFLEGEIAGFVGRHDEGSTGMLEILPNYKRRGIGTELLRFIIDYTIKMGLTPYGHILLGNSASVSLVSKQENQKICDEEIAWIFGN